MTSGRGTLAQPRSGSVESSSSLQRPAQRRMTIHLTIPSRPPIPSVSPNQESSSFEEEEAREKERANEAGLLAVSTAIRSSKRIVVLSGAGISVAAGIPDFRSSTGLFQSLGGSTPEESRRAGVTSGKELFDVSALNSPLRSSLHHRMLASLYQLASEAEPTPFHRMLKELDNEGRLLRVYTQNIDNLEERAGLTSGIPTTPPPPPRRLNKRQRLNDPPPPPSSTPTPPTPTPRSIPLHGLLTHLLCPLCPHTLPLSSNLHRLLPQPSTTDDEEDASPSPSFVDCPSCLVADEVRSAAEMRSRGIGRMRAGVVLYGEEHPRGEDIGRVVERDLRGSRGKRRVVKKEEATVGLEGVVGDGEGDDLGGLVEDRKEVASLGVVEEDVLNEGKADLLIVVGTSLAIPGTKTLVREFGKVVGGGKLKPPPPPPAPSLSSSSVGKKGAAASKGTTGLERVKTILLNLTPLAKPAETESMFDVFVQGDVQVFVEEYLAKATAVVPKPRKARKPKTPASTTTTTTGQHQPPSPPPQLQLQHLDDYPYQLLPRHSPFSSQASTSTSTSTSNAPFYPTPTSSIPSPSPASSTPAHTPSSSFSWDSNSPATCYVEIEVEDDARFKTPSKPKREPERDWEGEGESEVEESPTKGLGGDGSGGRKPSNWDIVGGGRCD